MSSDPSLPQHLKSLWFRTANVSEESLASDERVRQVGLIYQIYRLVVAIFLLMTSYAANQADSTNANPIDFFEFATVTAHLLVSLFLLLIFFTVRRHSRVQLLLGFCLDIILLTAYATHSAITDLQITLLLMIVVAASFMLLPLARAMIVVVLAVGAVIYQQFFYGGIHGHFLTLSDSILLCICLFAVGFLSWSISQRLTLTEQSLAEHTLEVEKLHAINQAVVQNMVNGVLVLDNNRDIVMINDPAQRMLRLSIDNDIHDNHAQMLQLARIIVNEHPELISWYRTINKNRPASLIYELKPDPSNSVDKLRINNKPLTDYGQLLILEDISREQSYAQTLKLASLGELSASIAHEIRNPLGAISQASQILIEDSTPEDDNIELYEMIVSQTKRVNLIIEDILSLSRQEKPTQQAINLYEWLIHFVNQHYTGESIGIIANDQTKVAVIYFDPNHLEQVMVNLVNNALRHTRAQPDIPDVIIKLSSTSEAGVSELVFVDIIDHGDGVADEHIAQLFHPFFTTSKKGTGLGLYLSQSFSEANGAKLRYIKGEKSCFRLIISKQQLPAHLSAQSL